MTAFWFLAPVIVVAALGVLFAKRAVHAALLLAIVMIGLAMLYAALDAPFLFAVQIVVYTGAILMLFLFVIMLVGVDVADDVREQIGGHRVLTVVCGGALAVTLVSVVGQASLGTVRGFAPGTAGIAQLADLLFKPYVIAFEATSALLITATIGAMVLAHKERLVPKPGQPDLARRRLAAYAVTGTGLGQAPTPGTYATGNSVDLPALLPDGSRTIPELPGHTTKGDGS
ncbi:NADH:ubiquinone oxidoreductase subunit J [Nocardioides baekrokdamisoli]|uniref:NADH-quinone oxidoreductase subunit J n=1 Tax=Nocardioides baekrokdamisoli TaxID=1804624 RepID=A0A3G9IFN5_9ACTN|nr:NADH-quinone oxidoreductase subunit J [Nocardioides baekrokdamisoli]BBH17860.1 NADH:ubiquinone oxidoreductase subunit J [Nocardioides baekrokdamisoli]